MGLFTQNPSAVTTHGVYVTEVAPPAIISAQGDGVVALVEQFPWGPAQSLYAPTSPSDFLNTFAPAGMSRLGSGYLAAIRKGFPELKCVRVTHSDAAAATANLLTSTPATLATITAKWVGAAGNSIVPVTSASSDGITGHFKLTVSVSGASGSTVEVYDPINITGTGADILPDLTNSILLASFTKVISGTPTLTTETFSGGSDGAIAATDYVGTQGTGNIGLAQLEGDSTIRSVIFGDPGDSFRPTANAGLAAHVLYMGDRIGFINGPKGQSLSALATDRLTYGPNEFLMYCDPWIGELDDVTGASHLVAPTSFAASLRAQLSPSTKISWKNDEAIALLSGINSLEFKRGQGAAINTGLGIATFIFEKNGGFSLESDVMTSFPSNPAKKRLARISMGIYIASAFQDSIRGFVDGPNVQKTQDDIVSALDRFMDGLKKAQFGDPAHNPYVKDYVLTSDAIAAANSPTSIANGFFNVPLQAKTDAGMEFIFLQFQFGETITVTAH